MKTLLIVSGGAEAVPGIKRAREMGLHVVVSDGNPKAPGFRFADDKLVASTYDVEKQVQLASEFHHEVRRLDGVLCIASDVPLTVAAIAAELDLPGIPVKTARLSTDKLAMKEHFVDLGVPVPWFHEVRSAAQLGRLVRDRGLPMVLKPVDSRGARGVLQLTEGTNLDWAFHASLASSPSKRLILEEFLPGPQISTESILTEVGTSTPGFSDRNYEFLERFSPYIIENGGEQPSKLKESEQKAVVRTAESAAQALGVNNCTVKGDLVLTDDGPKVIELALRLSGGWFATDQIPLFSGVDMVGAAIRLALADEVTIDEITPQRRNGVAIRYFFPPPGRIDAIDGLDGLKAECPWVHRVGLFLGPGDTVEEVTDHTKRAGFVIAVGESRQEAVNRAISAVARVKITTAAL